MLDAKVFNERINLQNYATRNFQQQESYSYNVRNKDLDHTEKKHLFLNYASDGLLEDMIKLLDNGVDINSTYDQGGYTALMMAAMNSHVRIVKELIIRGANVTLTDWDHNKSAYELADNKIIKELLRTASKLTQS